VDHRDVADPPFPPRHLAQAKGYQALALGKIVKPAAGVAVLVVDERGDQHAVLRVTGVRDLAEELTHGFPLLGMVEVEGTQASPPAQPGVISR
jgi:hypothetical protein